MSSSASDSPSPDLAAGDQSDQQPDRQDTDGDAMPGARSRMPPTSWLIAVGVYAAIVAAAHLYVARPEYRFGMGRLALERDDMDQALHEQLQLARTPGGWPYSRMLEGKGLVRQQRESSGLVAPDLTPVLEAFNDAYQVPSLRPLSLVWAGQALLTFGDVKRARQALGTAIEADPSIADAFWLMGNVLIQDGQLDEAKVTLEFAAQRNPYDPRPHQRLGQLFSMRSQLSRAEEYFRQARRLNPGDLSVLADLAECLADQGKSDEAWEMLTTAAATPRILGIRAKCAFQSGLSEDALSLVDQALQALPAVQRARRAAPEYLPALKLKAQIELDLGRPERAIEALGQLAAAQPVDVQTREDLARAYEASGKEDLAREQEAEAQLLREKWERLADLERQFSARGDDAELTYQMALLCRELQRPVDAEQLLRRTLAINPQHAGAKASLQGSPQALPPERSAVPK